MELTRKREEDVRNGTQKVPETEYRKVPSGNAMNALTPASATCRAPNEEASSLAWQNVRGARYQETLTTAMLIPYQAYAGYANRTPAASESDKG